jgi:hypothetical protein
MSPAAARTTTSTSGACKTARSAHAMPCGSEAGWVVLPDLQEIKHLRDLFFFYIKTRAHPSCRLWASCAGGPQPMPPATAIAAPCCQWMRQWRWAAG